MKGAPRVVRVAIPVKAPRTPPCPDPFDARILRPLFPVTRYRSLVTGVIVGVTFAVALIPAFAEKKYDPGASDTEIKIGQTKPYSGPASAYSSAGKTQFCYFEMRTPHGGVNRSA